MVRAINIGPISITLYSLCILTGIILASIIICREAKKCNVLISFITNLIFWVIIYGIIGARLYYVIFNLDYYKLNPIEIIKVWNGGLAIHGGIIAGIITIYFYSKKYKENFIKILDILSPGVILAQGIGRWGNFFNGEAHGGITTKAFLESIHIPKFVIKGMYIDGNYYHPTFFYESLLCIIGFIILILIRKNKKTKTGSIFAIYLIWYGIIRFFIESLRTDSLMLSNLKMAQVISIFMIITGLIILITSIKKGQLYRKDKE